jgi:response regulator RpfG family c-di-GMP phosphodiesterase
MGVLAKSFTPANKKVGNVLLKLGALDPQQFEKAMAQAESAQQRIEDAVVELGIATEQDLLKALATHYRTRFVSTERLSKADLGRSTLEMVPRQVAETFQIFPVMFDPQSGALSVVTADPDDTEVLKQIQITSGAKEVKPFIGRPAGVRAAIAKCYGGDIHAFAMLDRAAHAQFSAMLDVYERNVVSDVSMAAALARDASGGTKRGERVVSERDMAQGQKRAAAGKSGSAIGQEEMLELLNVLVSLLETSRPDLRGHSAHVARFTRRMLERINVAQPTMVAIVGAAYLHDIGKMGTFHLTALNASEYDGHKTAAQRAVTTPSRVVESVHFPAETLDAIEQMYERYDGKGFPSGIAGKDISLGARVLAIADTYADLTQNPRNPYRKSLMPAEACGVLAKFKDTVFDPHLVDLFKNMVMGEDIRAKLLANRYYALLVDPDPEETTVLELRMIEQGFETKTARNAEQAIKILTETPMDVVISEVDLPQGDGLGLLTEARKHPWGKDVAWIFHTRRQGRAEVQKAFELGVADYVAKPAPTDVFVAKIKALLDQRAQRTGPRGVSGSLKEMGLPELVQVLFHGRKTGNLRIRSGQLAGEIHFHEGQVVNALFDKTRGADAFYQMLKLQDGEFGLDPSFVPQAHVIQESPEALLLEGMRRLDEGI